MRAKSTHRAKSRVAIARIEQHVLLQSTGIVGAHDQRMAHNESYDDIVRRTVPEPDSSFRPTREQEKQAREGYRALDADEQALQSRVTAALQSEPGADLTNVKVEIDRSTVILSGRVADSGALRRVEDAIARVSGVDTIHNQIVIG